MPKLLHMKNKLNYQAVFLSIFLLSILSGHAQDLIYVQSGSNQGGKVTQISSDKVFFTSSGKHEKAYFLPRSKVLFCFNSKGHFLVISKLPQDTSQAQLLINDFLTNTSYPNSDKLVTTQKDVIDCQIDKEDKKNVSYKTVSGTNQVKKSELAIIIYKTGSHKMIESEKKVVEPLAAAQSANLTALLTGSNQANARADSLSNAAAAATASQQAAAAATAREQAAAAATAREQAAAAQKLKADSTAVKVTPPPANNTGNMTTQHIPELGDVSFAEYEKKAVDKTQDLKKYLALLCDRSIDWVEANKAIDLAVDLFVNEDAIVETSSVNNQSITRFKIRDYLKRIKLIQYDRVQIEWANVHYVSKLRKGVDGNYYGTITFEQTFRGYVENKLVYGDVTRKNVEIILKTYNRNVEGKSVPTWDVFLSQIKVVTTKAT
jgi:hypothetical protein